MKPVPPATRPTSGPSQDFYNSMPRKGGRLSSGRDELMGDEPHNLTHVETGLQVRLLMYW